MATPFTGKASQAAVWLVGATAMVVACLEWHSRQPIQFFSYLVVAALTSGLTVRLPVIGVGIAAELVFVLLGIAEFGFGETIVLTAVAGCLHMFWGNGSRPGWPEAAARVCRSAMAATAAYVPYHSGTVLTIPLTPWPELMLSALLYSAARGAFDSGCNEPREGAGGATKQWWRTACNSCLVGATLAWLIVLWNSRMHWETLFISIPAIYAIHRAYRLYLGRLEDEKKHGEDIAALHLRTIEGLALAVEAKDFRTHEHLERVRVYALELGKGLGLSSSELDALRAAALLHDVGKLAVPEHIISKPGKLTPEEFERVKIHPVVGAEILERVQFPYPVAPIVRAHHEAWDGNGYPDGLKGEAIPIGARILAVVDCLDALVSDRQYRRALPLDEAMSMIAAESGKAFDPRVVEALAGSYRRLELLATAQVSGARKLSTDLKITKGAGPAAGFEEAPETFPDLDVLPALASISAARQEAHMLFELTSDLGSSLSLDETLSVVAMRLKRMVPYDTIAFYIRRERRLVPAYVSGEDYRFFSALEIPLGQGLSGRVAEQRTPLLNGDPTDEASYRGAPGRLSLMSSAMCLPLEGPNGVVAVMALYKTERNAFSRDHLRILQAISSKATLAIENALKYKQAEDSATTDFVTNLPNARSLFLRLDSELARSKRENQSLAIVVGDLNGFKQLNDRFGHLAGNEMLHGVAEALQATCRPYDYVARMGGDEFVLIFPGIRNDGIADMLARLDRVVTEAAARVCAAGSVSMSFGAALFPQDGEDAEQLLAEADRRMYKAKQNPRQAVARVLPMPAPLAEAASS